MPRVPKRKIVGTAGAVGGLKKKTNLYNRPEKIEEGTILCDLTKTEWKIGPSIGSGGFGEIYTACKVGEKKYDYVVKCEPHDNGPLFVEMHFYMRNAKPDDIAAFKKKNGLSSLGVPYMLGNGSSDINGIRHRFLVLPRFGSDINKFYIANGKRLPEGTVYRITLQMLDAYKFIHECGYVHGDLKAANILLGMGKGDNSQVYLVDFGLAAHYTTKAFKPDPKKMHNGTIEFTSRDAHMGVSTMRGDMEILAYNIIDWLGCDLPWVKEKLLPVPLSVQKRKEDFMANFNEQLPKIFPKDVHLNAALEYIKYVANMEYNETPDYAKCYKIFTNTLRALKVPLSGELILKLTSSSNNDVPSTSKALKTAKLGDGAYGKSKQQSKYSSESNDDNDDGDCIINVSDDVIDTKRDKTKRQGRKINNEIKTNKKLIQQSPGRVNKAKVKKSQSPIIKNLSSPNKKSKLDESILSSSIRKDRTPVSAKSHVRLSPRVRMSPLGSTRGNTIINNNITPNGKVLKGKTYEFNIELDVSVDANVVLNVKRKRNADKNAGNQRNKDKEKEKEKEKSFISITNSNSNHSRPGEEAMVSEVRNVSNNDSVHNPSTPITRKSKRLMSSSH